MTKPAGNSDGLIFVFFHTFMYGINEEQGASGGTPAPNYYSFIRIPITLHYHGINGSTSVP